MVNVLARAEIYNGYYGDWELDGIDVLIDVFIPLTYGSGICIPHLD